MKKIIFLLLISISGYFLYSAQPDTLLGQIRASAAASLESIGSLGKSKAEYEEELKNKTAELSAYEEVKIKMEADFVRMEANLPVCPITGQRATFTKRPEVPKEVIERIDQLRAEIEVLKTKV